MLKLINLKKLTAKTLIGILVAGSFVTQAGTKTASAGQCDNNGHGNNGDIIVTINGIDVLLTKFDPSNPGNGNKIEREIEDSNSNLNLTEDEIDDIKEIIEGGNYDYENKPKAGNDTDCDGINDEVEVGSNFSSPIDTDGDGNPDFVDSDSDDDGVSDFLEGVTDVDGDGVPDYLDTVDDSVSSNPIPSNTAPAAADSITLTGTLRDFRGYRDKDGNINSNGHEDFERKHNVDTNPSGQKFKYGLDTGITTDTLGADKKPVYAGGSYSTTTKANFDQWYRNVNGVNQSMSYDIELTKQPDSNVYSFNNNGSQFFPLNELLLGNEGRNRNFHFTYEIHTQFTYQGGETFNFSGDDDVWVYIDGQKVIDIGGVHGKTNASVNLDSLGLEAGETYDLDFFFAERHVTQSNFKIETTLVLETASNPDADDDNDGIPNILENFETELDSDGDGTPDYQDEDSDNNDIPDAVEVGIPSSPSDSDDDGTPNFQDTDDDGNGIPDIDEIGNNPDDPTNTDGVDLPDYQDTDDDNDGILDTKEIGSNVSTPTDTDDDGTPDYHDEDSDDDGIPDSREGADDFDGDGTPNYRDEDSDDDTIPDSVEGSPDVPQDFDQDGSDNFVDLDSDDDGIPDENEYIADSNDPDAETDPEDGDLTGEETIENVDGEDDGDNYLDKDSDDDGFDDDIDPDPFIKTYAD